MEDLMNIKVILKNNNFIGLILALVFLFIYSLTLSPSVNFIDSGELASACCTLGIAHATGYPLFTILGFLVSKLPVFGNEIYRLNFLSAIYCSIGLFFLFKLFVLMNQYPEKMKKTGKEEKNKNTKQKKQPENIRISVSIIIIAAIFSVFCLGLSGNYWEQSTQIEVYPLHCMFLSILLYLFTKNIYSEKQKPKTSISLKNEKGWLIFGLFLGLAFTNHMTTIFILPGFFYLYFATYGFNKNSYKRIALMFIPFFIGLAVYLYFPIRASQNPVINWGNPQTFEYFKWQLTGKQYQVWVFSSMAEAMKQLKYFINTIPKDFVFLPLLSGIFGLIFLFRNIRKIFYFTSILFLTCTLLAINYSIYDIDSYFLLSYFIIALWSGFGILYLYNYIKIKTRKFNEKYLYFALLLPLLLLTNYKDVDESRNYLVHDYTMNVLNSIEPNGIVISFQWDNWVSASYYFQKVKNIRKDVVIIDKELLRRSWYYNQLEINYPWLIEKSRPEINEFLKELYKFEHDLPYDPTAIQNAYLNVINSFIHKNITTNPIYVGMEIEKEIGAPYRRIPEGLLLRLYMDDLYHPYPIKDYRFTPVNKKGRLIDALILFYGRMFASRASYENMYGFKENALWYVNKALEIDPTFSPAVNIKRQIEGR
jgi:hypothetical protein